MCELPCQRQSFGLPLTFLLRREESGVLSHGLDNKSGLMSEITRGVKNTKTYTLNTGMRITVARSASNSHQTPYSWRQS